MRGISMFSLPLFFAAFRPSFIFISLNLRHTPTVCCVRLQVLPETPLLHILQQKWGRGQGKAQEGGELGCHAGWGPAGSQRSRAFPGREEQSRGARRMPAYLEHQPPRAQAGLSEWRGSGALGMLLSTESWTEDAAGNSCHAAACQIRRMPILRPTLSARS